MYNINMRIFLLLTLLALTGCTTTRTPTTSPPVEANLIERAQLARASVGAAKTLVTHPVAEAELSHAQNLLPIPTQRQTADAIKRVESVNEDNLVETYRELNKTIERLDNALVQARIREAQQREADKSNREALLMQTQITTYAAIGFMAAGMLLIFLKQPRMGVMTILTGGILLTATRIIATVPGWAYTTLFITAGLLLLITPLAMLWAYRAGIWTKPKKCGDYEIE